MVEILRLPSLNEQEPEIEPSSPGYCGVGQDLLEAGWGNEENVLLFDEHVNICPQCYDALYRDTYGD